MRVAPRCAFRFARCDETPPLLSAGGAQRAACWLWAADAPPSELPIVPSASVVQAESPGVSHSAPLVELRNLVRHFPSPAGLVRAVDGVSLSIAPGETLGLVGESGCGKTSSAGTLLRLYPVSDGEVHFDGQDITRLEGEPLRSARKHMQMIFQDPLASLNPRMRSATSCPSRSANTTGHGADANGASGVVRPGGAPDRVARPLPDPALWRSASTGGIARALASIRGSSSPTRPSRRWTCPSAHRSSICSRAARARRPAVPVHLAQPGAWSITSAIASR